jgi:hypothetical protein
MAKCLDLLADYLTYRKHKYERIDDKVCGDHRQTAIDRFSTGDAFAFLMILDFRNSRNDYLTAADTVATE